MVKPILRFIDQPYRHVAGDSVVFGLASVSINGISSVQVTVSPMASILTSLGPSARDLEQHQCGLGAGLQRQLDLTG
jgi:hypothetical protein